MWGLPFIENVRLKSFCKKSEMISLDRFLMYLLLDGILSIGGLSTALVAPPILLSCSATQIHTKGRRYQRLTLTSTAADSIELSHYKPVDKLEQMCNACARKSNLHPNGESADWINVNSLAEISMSLNDTCLLAASTFGSFLLSSPLPAKSVIFEGSNYILSLLTVPSGMVVPLKNTDPSSILLYKPLRGFGELSTITDKGTIIDKVDGNNEFNTINHDVFQKKGGFLRQFSSRDTGAGSSIFLELEFTRRRFQGGPEAAPPSVAAPATSSEGLALNSFTLIQPPLFELRELFESSIENDRRNSEMLARNALLSANAKKYDILERIRFRVGGLSSELGDLVRRVLSSRQISSSILRKLGISHIKGILLYGPPGTGKTLIAREMAKALNSREPILINGPEIMDKYVGEAEKNIRDLFKPAEEEWATRGQESELHVIIFDEFDSVAKKRGSLSGDGSGVRDSCVNQLLSKLDGVEEMNNVLVICLTNRKDLIDSALLRPGRLEVHIEIKPPDLEGREEILYILFKPMVLGGYVSFDDAKKWSQIIAKKTYGYTGADLTGLIRNAASFAIERSLNQLQDVSDKEYNERTMLSINEKQAEKTKKKVLLEKSIFLTYDDIERASSESAKDLRISKRARIGDFVSRNLSKVQLLSRKKGKEEMKIVKRSFEDIVNSIDYNAEEALISGEDVEDEAEEKKEEPVKPVFQNIGGTLIF